MITIPFKDPSSLWQMDDFTFNQWRRENDLPILFQYFSDNLPYFDEWVEVNNFNNQLLLEVVPTGSLFKGDSEKNFVRYVRYNDENHRYCRIIDDKMLNILKNNSNNVIQEERKIIPYILWGQRKLKKRNFIDFQLPNEGKTDTFIFNCKRTETLSNGVNITRAVLYNKFQVLKLGGVRLSPLLVIRNRNLDFTDMDGIKLIDNFVAEGPNISYSSCSDMIFINSKVYFLYFFQCVMDNFYCNNSSIQDIHYHKCQFHTQDRYGFMIENSNVYNLELDKCDIYKIGINNCEINGFKYTISTKCDVFFEYDNLRRIRTAFQSNGNRSEASKYYILERKYEAKTLLFSHIPWEKKYPRLSNRYPITSLIVQFWNKEIELKGLLKYFFERILYYIELFFFPKYVFSVEIFKRKIKYISSFLENIFWGYGEKPSRTLLISFLAILFYSCIYFSNKCSLNTVKNYSDSLYFSVITFSTLGYGDILPQTSRLRLICGSEALLGIMCTGMFVAGFANKSKY